MFSYASVLASCAGIDIPNGVFNIVHYIIILIQVVVPVLLIIWGMLDFAKGVVGKDEEAVKAGQKVFIQRLVTAIIVFLIVTVVKLVVNIVSNVVGSDTSEGGFDEGSVTSCINAFVNGAD